MVLALSNADRQTDGQGETDTCFSETFIVVFFSWTIAMTLPVLQTTLC
jgi:hypothetical protein